MFPSERHKGRSSSFAISRVLQGSVAYILGSNLYPGLLHCYSSANRSDGPSRGRDVEPPTRDLPDWFLQLAKGDYRKFDAVVCSSRYSKNPARWLRFLLLLCGDIERNPGPKRGKMNLNIGFVKATSERMIKCLAAFQRWVVGLSNMHSCLSISLQQILRVCHGPFEPMGSTFSSMDFLDIFFYIL